MTAYTYEKLLFKYWNLDTESYDALSENDEKRHLPKSLQKIGLLLKLYTMKLLIVRLVTMKLSVVQV